MFWVQKSILWIAELIGREITYRNGISERAVYVSKEYVSELYRI
jgi:hypothetical protein